MARESLLSASGSADGRLAVLGSRHLAILDSLGKGLRLESLPGPSRPVSVLLSAKGAVALLYPDMVSIERAEGAPLWPRRYAISTSLALSDGRLVFGLRGDAADPFAKGALLLVAMDSIGGDGVTLSVDRVRSRITAPEEQSVDLVVHTTSGTFSWPLAALPFARWSGRTPAPSRPQ
jgi:hypothetical protein